VWAASQRTRKGVPASWVSRRLSATSVRRGHRVAVSVRLIRAYTWVRSSTNRGSDRVVSWSRSFISGDQVVGLVALPLARRRPVLKVDGRHPSIEREPKPVADRHESSWLCLASLGGPRRQGDLPSRRSSRSRPDGQTITAADPVPDDLRQALDAINSARRGMH
jgi:hypothetical protein